MVLEFKNGKTLKVDSIQENYNRVDKASFLQIYSTNLAISISELNTIITDDSITSIRVIDNNGELIATLTDYTQVMTIKKRISDFERGYDIVLADANYKMTV